MGSSWSKQHKVIGFYVLCVKGMFVTDKHIKLY